MASPSRSAIQAKKIFAKRKRPLRTRDVLRLGIHPRTLYRLRDEGFIECVSRGLYRLRTLPGLMNPDWTPIALRAPKAIFCLISALAYHRLTTQVPHTIDIAIPSHSQVPKIDGLPIRAFWFAGKSRTNGLQRVKMDGVTIRIYSPEKTIADCFKYRNKIGIDIAIEALRAYHERTGRKGMAVLLKYAAVCRVKRVMTPYLEAIL